MCSIWKRLRSLQITYLLRDVLHGWGSLVFCVHINPAACEYDSTACVLQYAAIATQIGNAARSAAPKRAITAKSPQLGLCKAPHVTQPKCEPVPSAPPKSFFVPLPHRQLRHYCISSCHVNSLAESRCQALERIAQCNPDLKLHGVLEILGEMEDRCLELQGQHSVLKDEVGCSFALVGILPDCKLMYQAFSWLVCNRVLWIFAAGEGA